MLWHKAQGAGGAGGGIKFVSSAIDTAGFGTTITVSAPAGIQDGDVLVALGSAPNGGSAVTPPSGFTVRLYDATPDPTFYVFTKTASSESGNYTFTFAGNAGNKVFAILVYRGATETDVLIGSVAKSDGFGITAPSISPTSNGALIGFYAVNAGPSTVTVPSGMTQREFTSPVAIFDAVPNPSGSTGTKTATFNDDDSIGGFLMQIYEE